MQLRWLGWNFPRGVSESDGVVERCRCEELAVRRECYCVKPVGMALKGATASPRGGIPEADGLVGRCRREEVSVR
jgi:hypothetical protein